MQRFHDKIAIATGTGSGIGRAAARRLAAEGAAVTIADIDEAGAGTTVDLIRSDGGTARAQATDVAEPDAVERMVADTLAAYGGLDLLHNNAAAINLSITDQDVVTMQLEIGIARCASTSMVSCSGAASPSPSCWSVTSLYGGQQADSASSRSLDSGSERNRGRSQIHSN